MAGLTDSLWIAGSGILAQQRGAQITGHNIANVNTPGYRRQDVVLQSRPPTTLGVDAKMIQHASDVALTRQRRAAGAQNGYATERQAIWQAVEAELTPSSGSTLGADLGNFYGAWRELASAPDDLSQRSAVVARTEDVARGFRDAAAALTNGQQNADRSISAMVGQVNTLSAQVAALNKSIALTETTGQQALDLRDQRDAVIDQLSALVGATSFEDQRGQATVMVGGGIAIVQGDNVRNLTTTMNAATGLHTIATADGAAINLDRRLSSGKIGGLLALRDNELPSRMAELDQLAYDFATTTNTAHQAGIGLDGVGGRDLFVAPAAVAGAAAGLALNAAIATNPRLLGAAQNAASLPGDGTAAQALAALETSTVAGGGSQTTAEAAGSWYANIGLTGQNLDNAATTATNRLATLADAESSLSGVSLEEQMILMTQYERAYQASARVLTVVDQMMETLVQL